MKKIKLCAIVLALALLAPFSTMSAATYAEAATSTEGMDISGKVLWEYTGNETTVTIPNHVKTIKAGAFYGTKVEVVIIPHDILMRGNTFAGAHYLTDIYIYYNDMQHMHDLYSGQRCLNGELACIDNRCAECYDGIYTTFLSDVDTNVDRYVSKTLTIHGYKGSTAERFVELVNGNPTLFNCPQTIVFQAIEDEPKEDGAEDNAQDTEPTEPDTEAETEEDIETPEEPPQDTPEEAPQEPPVVDNDTEEGTDEGDKEEAPDEPPKAQKGEVHLKGTSGTELYIDNFNGITYPRNVYMDVGSYYIIELGNVPEGYTYQIQEVYSSLYTLDAQTGEFTALRNGMTTVKIRLNYPDGRYANLSCKIYIKGD